jgi:hypothetical protein
MTRPLTVAILLISTMPLFAQGQQPNVAKLKADVGSIRRECTDHLLVFNADHLRRILAKYASYYNEVRTHVSLGSPIERFGDIVAYPILGGLHHRYARI